MLSPQVLTILRRSDRRLVIPRIVLAELKYLASRARTSLPLDIVLDTVKADPTCRVHPLDIDVIQKMPVNLEIHDAIICGTALAVRNLSGEQVKLITKDARIRDAAIVETVW